MKKPESPEDPHLTQVVARNISALIAKRREDDRQRPREERVADAISQFTGSMRFVYLHVVFFGCWIVGNLPGVPWPRFDPSYVILAMSASVEAIFLSTFVLITQNRTTAMAEKRAELDLQISLLAEHEITHLIKLVSAIATRMNIDEARDPELRELRRDVRPERVLDHIDQQTDAEHRSA